MSNPLEDWLTRPDGLSVRLRAMRSLAGMSGVVLAEKTGWAQSKVSRIETGRQMPTRADLTKWVAACGLDQESAAELVAQLADAEVIYRDWQRRQRHGQAAVQRDYAAGVQAASLMRYFETVFVPGLLQTQSYARHLLGLLAPDREPDDLDAAVVERIRSQQAIYDPGKRFEFLIAESVLHWWPCSPEVMRGQLDRLQTVVDVPNVRFGILPMRRQITVVPVHGFVLVDDEVALIETFNGEITHTGEEAAQYVSTMNRLWSDAITGDAVRRLIINAMPSSS